MGRAIKKVANSVDPRDWDYLQWWQSWSRAMPPLLYRYSSPGCCPVGHWMDTGNYVPPYDSFLSTWADTAIYYDFLLVNIPGGPIPFFVKEFYSKITVYDPNGPLPLDPDGLPFNWHLLIRMFDTPWLYNTFEAFALNTPYDAEIFLPGLDSMGNPNPHFPNGIRMTPVPFNTPTTNLTAADICQ